MNAAARVMKVTSLRMRQGRNENDITNDLNDAEISAKGAADTTVPGISKNEKSEETSSPRGGK